MVNIDLSQFDNVPAGMPPPGVTPNLIDPPSRAALPKYFALTTLPLMLVFLFLRLYTRVAITRKFGIDDGLCILAAATMIAYCGMLLSLNMHSDIPGRHMWDVPLSTMTPLFSARMTLLNALYLLAAMFIKGSILVLYRRIFRPSFTVNVLVWIGIVVNGLLYIICFSFFMAYCTPKPEDDQFGGWISLTLHQRCNIMIKPLTYSTGIVGSVIDVYILIIPLIPIYGLSFLSGKRKLGICSIFIIGSSACVFSIVGAVYRLMIQESDPTWGSMPVYAMHIGEINFGIISGSMPVIFALCKGFAKRYLSKFKLFRRSAATDEELYGEMPQPHQQLQKPPGTPEVFNKEVKLPPIPKAKLSGLKTWMRNLNRTTPAETKFSNDGSTGSDTLASNLTYASADYDYHRHMR